MTPRTPLTPEESRRAAQALNDVRQWLKEKQAEAQCVRSQAEAHWIGYTTN